ncbi:MAG: hypothetical protein ACLVG7_01740 [Negativibacillus sp.]
MEGNYTLSDIRAVTDGNDGMFGGNGLWFLALLFLFGNGGFGWGNRNGAPVTEADLCSANSFNDLKSGVRDISGQISSMNIGLTKGLCDMGYTMFGQFASLERQLADCCCGIERNIDGVNYNVAQQAAAINANTTAQTQKILDAITGNRMADMQNQINNLQLQSALCGVVRYPTATTYATNCNPFFGGYGCGCANI